MIVEVAPKRLELLHELLPTTTRMALLVNPADRALAQSQSREVLWSMITGGQHAFWTTRNHFLLTTFAAPLAKRTVVTSEATGVTGGDIPCGSGIAADSWYTVNALTHLRVHLILRLRRLARSRAVAPRDASGRGKDPPSASRASDPR